jgi:hypothetical protein
MLHGLHNLPWTGCQRDRISVGQNIYKGQCVGDKVYNGHSEHGKE